MNERRYWLLLIFILFINMFSMAQAWRDEMELVTYSPRYFGANAFPMPELTGGRLSARWEIELRGDYHTMPGDKTKDIFAKVYVPIANGRAGISINGVISEWYETSEEVRVERHAAGRKVSPPCNGDVILNFLYQVLRSDRWFDAVVTANLKTASGNRLSDARYTDAATYWFTAEMGRALWKNDEVSAYIRAQAMAGFYCWMTNDRVHRQNDGLTYGVGLSGGFKWFTFDCDFSGFRGYENNGDRPMVFRTKLSYELKKNIISFRYKHGIKDYLYDSFSLGYTRCF